MRTRKLLILATCASLVAAACGETKPGLSATKSESASPTVDTERPQTPPTTTRTTEPDDTTEATTDDTTDDTTEATTDDTTDDTTDRTTDDTTDETTDDTSGSVDPSAPTIKWQDWSGDGSIEDGHIEVPIDYTDPSKGDFDLYIARHKATNPSQRIGTLLVNRGGPGFESADFALYADQIYSDKLVSRFDIVAWDPRGTGLSTPAIDCVDDYDKYFAAPDITPDDDAEKQENVELAKEFEDACYDKNKNIFQFVGTNDTARDMDTIRRALGEDKITYFGFSYGSELGATWATMFPDTVRAAALDGASDPNADFLTSGLQQTKGFEDALTTFLQKCSANSECLFNNGGNAEGAFDALMKSVDDNPIPTETGRPDVNLTVALTAVTEAMYAESIWPRLEQALADAQQGDGKGLLDLYDEYYQRQPDGTYDNSLEAFQVITCVDTDARPTVEEADAEVPEYTKIAPRIAAGTVGSYFCTFFPESEHPRIAITGAGAGPILVVGTTGDPATPLESSQAMADALQNGELLTVEADQHTGYDVNACSRDTVDNYLLTTKLPPNGTKC
jgi:pimeloyl-ACP methyl ester carboxylesterase